MLQVIVGQNITSGVGKYTMTRQLLASDALTAFQLATTAQGNKISNNFKVVLEKLREHVSHSRASTFRKGTR